MSWTGSGTTTTEDGVSTASLTFSPPYDGASDEVREQMEVAAEVADRIVTSGVVGAGGKEHVVQINGHANPGHEPQPGSQPAARRSHPLPKPKPSPMPRPSKTLLELVMAGTYRRGRHADLLATQDLPAEAPYRDKRRRVAWSKLREAIAYYRERVDDVDACDVALQAFSEYLNALHGGRWPAWSNTPDPAGR